MSCDENSEFYIINYIESIPKNFPTYYLESRSISGFSANYLDEIQDLLKQIEFLESAIEEIKQLVTKENLMTRRRIKKIEALKIENEELKEIIRNNEDLNIEYKKMLEREGDSRNILCAKLLEKETEIEECMEVIEDLKKKIIGIDQMRKLQTNQIAQLKDSLPDSSQRQRNNSCEEVDSPALRKITRDIDLLTKEKDQIESTLKIKSEDFEVLEKKYLTALRKTETLMKQNQQQEVKLLESNQEIMNLKSRMKTLKNSLNFANRKIFENMDKNILRPENRKAKSLLVQPKRTKSRVNMNVTTNEYLPPPSFQKRATLLEEVPVFYSPRVSNFHLDFSNKDDRSSQHSHQSQYGHQHQESFGLQNKAVNLEVLNIVDHENLRSNDKGEESPKFARSGEISDSMESSSTIEVDPAIKNPHPKSRCSNDDYQPQSLVNIQITTQTNFDNTNNNANKSIFNLLINKRMDSNEETRKKLIEIEKKGPGVKETQTNKNFKEDENSEKPKSLSKMENLMRMTLNMIPSGTFFTKMMDLSEDILNK